MPRYDGTGPWGQGPGSGWGLGPCGFGRRRGYGGGFGRGAGRGFGRGARGFGSGAWGRPRWGQIASDYPPVGPADPGYEAAPQDEAQALRDEQAYLQGELEAIQNRLAELEAS